MASVQGSQGGETAELGSEQQVCPWCSLKPRGPLLLPRAPWKHLDTLACRPAHRHQGDPCGMGQAGLLTLLFPSDPQACVHLAC